MNLWLEPFKEEEKVRRSRPHKDKYGGPNAQQLGISLEKQSSDKRSCYGCVFYEKQKHNCSAGLYTQNADVHNGCFNSGMVWVRSA